MPRLYETGMQQAAIREATVQDLPAILDLWCEFMDLHADLDEHFRRAEDGTDRFRIYLESRIEEKDSQLLVADIKSTVVGYALGRIQEYPRVLKDRRHGRITDLAVQTKSRRQGIGSSLYESLVDWFRSREIQRVEISVVPSNKAAKSFWVGKGFYIFHASLARDLLQ